MLILLKDFLIKFYVHNYLSSIQNFNSTITHLICTLISENEGLEKLRSVANLRKISVSAHLIFFSVCHLSFFQNLYHRSEKNSGDKLKKKSGVQDLKFF